MQTPQTKTFPTRLRGYADASNLRRVSNPRRKTRSKAPRTKERTSCALRARLGVLTLAGVLGACASYASTVHQFDGLIGYDQDRGSEADTYALRRKTVAYPFWAEAIQAFADDLGIERREFEVEFPHKRLRKNMRLMVEQSGQQLERLAELSWRCLLVLDQDGSPLNRATAIRCLAQLAERSPRLAKVGEPGLELPGRRNTAARVAFRASAREIVRTLADLWMREEGERRDEKARAAFEDKIQELAALQATSLAHERGRLRVLGEALVWERDPRSQQEVARALLACMRSAVFRGLRQALRDPEVLPRLAALDAFWRLGRKEYLAYSIASLRKGLLDRLPEGHASRALIDEDARVRRKISNFASAIPLESTIEPVGEGPSPVRFLVDTGLRDPERGLRLGARHALSVMTKRDFDPEGAWIAEWWERLVTQGSDRG